MNSREIENLIEILYPLFKERIKNESFIKNGTKMKNATVVSSLTDGETNINQKVDVILPYDTTSFSVINRTGEDLQKGDLVCLMYWIDLKNAVAQYKVK